MVRVDLVDNGSRVKVRLLEAESVMVVAKCSVSVGFECGFGLGIG